MGGGLAGLAAIFLAILALASVAASRRSIALAWRPGQRLQAASAQVLVTGGILSATTLVANRDLLQSVVIATFVALVLFAELSDASGRRLPPISVPSIHNQTPVGLILAFWAWLYTVDLWFMAGEGSHHALFRTASGVALFVFLLAQRYRPITLLHFYSASLLSIAAIVVTLPFTPDSFIACGRFKCNELDAILRGPFQSENFFGLAAAMCAVLCVMAVPISRRTAIVLAFLVGTTYATYSRTSLLALAAALILVAIELPLLTKRSRKKTVSILTARVVAATCVVIPMTTGLILVYYSGSGSFSNRGRIWARGREAVSEYPLTGRGLDSWDLLVDSGYFGKRFDSFPHSEYLLIYFCGGVIGLLLFGLVLYRITVVAITVRNLVARGAAVPVTFATVAIAETLWNPLNVDFGTWIFFALVACCVPPEGSLARRRGRDAVAAPEAIDRVSDAP